MSATAIASTRVAELEAALDNFERIHLEWVDQTNRTNPDATYWDGVVGLIEVFHEGDTPESMKAFAAAVDVLDKALEDFDERPDVDNLMPRDSFWKATEGIFNLRKQQRQAFKPKRLESMQELNEQKVPLWQIAKIYKLLDENGEPDQDAVRRELATPGSVIGPDWVHPDEQDRRRQLERQAERRSAITSTTRQRVKAAKPVCPESCEELFRQGVSAAQVAKMLGREEEEIQAEYDAFRQAKAKSDAEAKTAATVAEKGGRQK